MFDKKLINFYKKNDTYFSILYTFITTMNKTLQYNPRSSRYATLSRRNTIVAPPNFDVNEQIEKKKVLKIDEDCWEDMIDLAENYYRQCNGKSI